MFGENSNFEHIAIILALEGIDNLSLDCQNIFSMMIDASTRASITMYLLMYTLNNDRVSVEGTM